MANAIAFATVAIPSLTEKHIPEQHLNGKSSAKRTGYVENVIPFKAGDGFQCNLVHVQGERTPSKGPVLLVHGAGVRANIFRAPVETNFVDFLISNGYDVWLENWRASIEFSPNQWTLDQAAVYDHPEAVKTVVKMTGSDRVKAVIHCQGSTSFMMSAVAGLVPQVTTIVTNAVSLHPVVPGFSRVKLGFVLPMVAMMTDYLNPHWGVQAPTVAAKLISFFVELTHHECHNSVCKQVSFTYGSGFPALWSHANLNDETHEWLKGEFNAVPMAFFEQMARCVRAGHLVPVDGLRGLPDDFTAEHPRTEARFAFFAGEQNLCFLPESQVRTYDFFSKSHKDYHSLYRLSGYGHLDVFMGKNAVNETYPLFLQELDRKN